MNILFNQLYKNWTIQEILTNFLIDYYNKYYYQKFLNERNE